ncbi:hypothetical protein ANN_19043 [Periplaneta americana]|uniref:DDE Tnp4 domain-containing protein n=1 Tax=Periplaneta americana TaxID=6978 RepID=A0ABQ8SSJ7_PERAM|nr:hypothetical protein ANN_19043 [Periplaneta americana]
MQTSVIKTRVHWLTLRPCVHPFTRSVIMTHIVPTFGIFQRSMMEVYRRKRAVFAYLVYKNYLKRTERGFWEHPLVAKRLLQCTFTTMFTELREDDTKFFNYFRMSIKSFDDLACKISDVIKSEDTVMRLAISPLEKLCVTLRYLGSGCYIIDLHYSYRIGHSTLCTIIRKVCKAIWDRLLQECIPKFCTEKWLQIAERFEKRANFPNCLGALDGKHVRIVKPTKTGSLCHNYKNYFSIVLFAIADSNYEFLYIDVGSFGRESDCTIFETSQFFHFLQNNELDIPKGMALPGTAGPNLPFTFVADEAFSFPKM